MFSHIVYPPTEKPDPQVPLCKSFAVTQAELAGQGVHEAYPSADVVPA
jgi:hypothetical protein